MSKTNLEKVNASVSAEARKRAGLTTDETLAFLSVTHPYFAHYDAVIVERADEVRAALAEARQDVRYQGAARCYADGIESALARAIASPRELPAAAPRYRLNKSETDFCRSYGHALGNAENDMIGTLGTASGLSAEDAGKVFDLYRKHKLLKFDRTNSRFTVKHGALLDGATIRNALASITAPSV